MIGVTPGTVGMCESGCVSDQAARRSRSLTSTYLGQRTG